MKMVTWQALLKYFNGSLTGGDVVVRINKKHISLGKVRGGVFDWTPAGLELANTVVIPRGVPVASPSPAAPAPKGRARGRPRTAAIAPETGDE
jgi:hypothetical protein